MWLGIPRGPRLKSYPTLPYNMPPLPPLKAFIAGFALTLVAIGALLAATGCTADVKMKVDNRPDTTAHTTPHTGYGRIELDSAKVGVCTLYRGYAGMTYIRVLECPANVTVAAPFDPMGK